MNRFVDHYHFKRWGKVKDEVDEGELTVSKEHQMVRLMHCQEDQTMTREKMITKTM